MKTVESVDVQGVKCKVNLELTATKDTGIDILEIDNPFWVSMINFLPKQIVSCMEKYLTGDTISVNAILWFQYPGQTIEESKKHFCIECNIRRTPSPYHEFGLISFSFNYPETKAY